MTQLVVPHLEKRGGGSVVFVSSVAGYQPMQALGPYSVSKTALLGLTRALAPELAHIRVNCVAPGVIKTPFSQAVTTPPLSILSSLPVYPFHFTYPPYPHSSSCHTFIPTGGQPSFTAVIPNQMYKDP
ncbi:dehydrogenase/reductase SDR family member 4-like [Salvelinus fontinalis]|uniref:dehydrogenase/reductase SDR family member 4-like n=1 Tax=Salvelinus fontinalis TaxID=8038 RepID=UPI002484D7D0|nr:dehydrogenase/reductase SDR family member 4-like [Salvelinus fontinalis]